MKNTGITYTSEEKTPSILTEMEQLLPPLTEEQRETLQADILSNGCYAPIIVNDDLVIIDGHNRYSICKEHDLPFGMVVFSFVDMLEAKQWALDTQKGRRNMEKWELGKIARKLKPDVEARARENMGTRTDLLTTLSKGSEAINTRKEIANAVGIGEVTMGKVMQLDENAPDAIKEALDHNELSIHQGYEMTKQLQELPEDEREQAAIDALEFQKAKQDLRKADAEIDRQHKIATVFCKAFEKANALEVTQDNVRIWTESTCMTTEEIEDVAKEARESAQSFSEIAYILESLLLSQDRRSLYYDTH